MLDKKMESIHNWLDRVKRQAVNKTTHTHWMHNQAPQTYARPQMEDMESWDEKEEIEEFKLGRRPCNQPIGVMRNGEEDHWEIKIKIPSF